MNLRPSTFYLPSSSSIKIYFNKILSENLSVKNFQINSLTGTSEDLVVKKIEVEKNSVTIYTNPQNAKTYYLIKLKDSDEFPFESEDGFRLINDKASRNIFFVASPEFNPIRDRIFNNLSNIYNLEGTLIEDIVSEQARQLHKSQRSVGELLSDNYLRVPINDEIRTRNGTSLDRLANENCFKIKRVSLEPTANVLAEKELDYTNTSLFERHSEVNNIISLQEELFEEEITITKDNRYLDGLLFDLNKNIIKLLSITLVDQNDIKTEYNINKFSYLIKDNRYDKIAKNFETIKNNQIIIPPLTNISSNKFGDVIKIKYLSKNKSISPAGDFEAYELINNFSEAIPTNTNNFYLSNFNIVNLYGDKINSNGLTIRKNQSSSSPPFEFSNEIVYGTRVPSNPGEFSVNYETGEVFVYGLDGTGVQEVSYYVKYNYKRILEENYDYYIYDKEFVLNKSRSVLNKNIYFKYQTESVFIEGEHYLDKTHVEVLNEKVGNNISTSFSILTKNSPIAQIFRIFNRTTGEIYNPLYAIENKVFFSGNRSPEIKIIENKQVFFDKVFREEMFADITTINPAFVRTIVSASNPSNIIITPGIPSHLIDRSSEDYYIKDIDTGEDFSIKYFGGGAVINSIAINGTILPRPKSQIHIGTKLAVINLKNDGILSKENTIGSVLSSSVKFDSEFFKVEKFFESANKISVNNNFNIPLVSSMLSEKIFSNIQRLRKVGEYGIDYENGIAYVAIPKSDIESLGYIDYSYNVIDNSETNILTVNSMKYVNVKNKSFYNIDNNLIIDDKIKIKELNKNYETSSSPKAFYGSNEYETNIVLDNYEIITTKNIFKLNGLYSSDSVFGKDVNLPSGPTISELSSENIFDKNILNSRSLYFDQNKIDLKYSKSFFAEYNSTKNSNDIIIENKTAKVIEIFDIKTNKKICDQDLVNRKKEIFYSSVTQGSGSFIINVIDPEALNSIASGDFITNESSESFNIISYSFISKTISCSGTFSGNSIFIATKGKYIITEKRTKIRFDTNSDIKDKSEYLIKYVDKNTPSIGTAFFTDYVSGYLEYGYSYVHDDIEVSYEFGDNSLDWSLSDDLNEGDNYYVSYEYGALRGALERNFANLVQLPYFQNFSLNKNREIFRDALEGALQSFSQGPLISSVEKIVESITKTKPEVIEKFFGNWILGRTHLSEKRIKYSGDLSYEPVKYDTGLHFKEDTSVIIPGDSSVKLDSGSISFFFKNKWDGIENDAAIIFELFDFGDTKFIYDTEYSYNSPQNNVTILNFLNSNGILTNPNVLRISNYKYDPETKNYKNSEFGFIKKFKNINTLDKFKTNFKFKNNILNIKNIDLKNNSIVSNVMFNDGTKSSLIENKISDLGSFSGTILQPFISSYDVEKLSLYTKISGKTEELFDIFTKVINIKFSTPLNFQNILSKNDIVFNEINNKNIFIYNSGYIYEIESFVFNDLKTNKASSLVQEINLKFIPLNLNNSQEYESLNKLAFTSNFKIMCLKSEVIFEKFDFNLLNLKNNFLINYNDYNSMEIVSHSIENVFDVVINNKKQSFLWSDLYLETTLLNYFKNKYSFSDSNSIELIKNKGFKVFTSNSSDDIDIFSKDISINISRYLNIDKIYIGSRGYNPKTTNFSISNLSKDIDGLKNIYNDGLYIGQIEQRIEEEKRTRKIWKVISRVRNEHSLPDRIIISDGNVEIKYKIFNLIIDHSGKITARGDINFFAKLIQENKIDDIIDGYIDGY